MVSQNLLLLQATAMTLPSLDEILGVQTCCHRCGCHLTESHDCSTDWSVVNWFGDGGQIFSGQSHDQGLLCHPPNAVPNTALAERHSTTECLEVRGFTLLLVAFDHLSLLGGHSYFASSLTLDAHFYFLPVGRCLWLLAQWPSGNLTDF